MEDIVTNFKEIAKALCEYFGRSDISIIETTYKEEDESQFEYNGMFAHIDRVGRNDVLFALTMSTTDGKTLVYNEIHKIIHNRLFCYFDNIGYENNTDNRVLLLMLHEFGHFDYIDKMNKLDCLDVALYGSDMMRGLAQVAIDQSTVDEMLAEGIDAYYMLRGDEMYCDAFALKHFVPARQYLIEKGIIG